MEGGGGGLNCKSPVCVIKGWLLCLESLCVNVKLLLNFFKFLAALIYCIVICCHFDSLKIISELKSCVKVEEAVLGFISLISLMFFVVITPKNSHIVFCPLNSVLLNLLCVWILF